MLIKYVDIYIYIYKTIGDSFKQSKVAATCVLVCVCVCVPNLAKALVEFVLIICQAAYVEMFC